MQPIFHRKKALRAIGKTVLALAFASIACAGCSSSRHNESNPFKEQAQELKYPVGTKMADGTIYAGVSRYDNHANVYAAPEDEKFDMTLDEAKARAQGLVAETGKSYHVPTEGELRLLCQNQAAIGGKFNQSGYKDPSGWYWTSSQYDGAGTGGTDIRFADCATNWNAGTSTKHSVRLVRND